jgi:dsDNA-specific endonuclease/ATPase MutS2
MATMSELAEKRLKEAREKAEQLVKDAKEKLAQAKALEQKKAAKKKLSEAKKDRSQENRKKMLIGAMYFERMSKAPEAESKILAQLDKWLTRPSERAVFGFTVPEKPGE